MSNARWTKKLQEIKLYQFLPQNRKFGGYASDEKCLKEKEKFMSILEADGIKVKNDAFFCAFYNTPFKLFNRRNEIWLIKEIGEIEQPSLPSLKVKLDVEREQ